MEHQNNYDEISLRELIEALLRQKKLIAVITAAAIALAGIYSFIILKPTYEASMLLMTSSTQLIDKELNTDSVGNLLDSITDIPGMNVQTYQQQILSPEVLDKTINDLGMGEDYTIRTLANKISIENIKDTSMIKIKMVSTEPDKASSIINSIGENFIEFAN